MPSRSVAESALQSSNRGLDRTGPIEGLLRDPALLYVSGKGGSGKTTVATALGVAAARLGRRTLVCELAGGEQIERAFGHLAGPGAEIRLARDLWCLSLDPRRALREWLRRQPGGAVADAVLSHARAFAEFVDAAPGAKELVTIGKLLDLAGLDPAGAGPAPYELVIADGPSTGHALGMLEAPGAVSRVTPKGPIAAQARTLRDVLADPGTSAYVGVTLPEEMSVHEVLEYERGLGSALGRGLDLIVVNGVYPDRFTDEEAEKLEALARRSDGRSVLRAALGEHRRARMHADQVRALRAQTRTPVITLPYVFVAAIAPADYERLAGELLASNWRSASSASAP